MSVLLEGVVEFLWLLWLVVYRWLQAVVLAFTPTSVIAKDISGQIVLVTGAGNGIGRQLALDFAAYRCRLALWDVNMAANEETAGVARSMGATVMTYRVDVSDKEQVYSTSTKVTSDLGPVDILVNNAGIVTGERFLDCPDSMIVRTMQVNTLAHFWTVKAFLPAMLSRNHGHVVIVASSAGLLGVTRLADYCSSKFAAVGFAESLRYELQALGKDGIHTTVICPYLTATGMFEGCRVRFPWLVNVLDPENVSEEIVKAVLRNQEILILPRLLYFFIALKGLLPVKCLAAICNYMGASAIMDTFKGRTGRH